MLTVAAAAERAGRDPETIRRWIRAGRLAAWKVGGQHMIDEGALAEALRPRASIARAPTPPHDPRGVREAAIAYGSVPDLAPSVPVNATDRFDPLLTQIVGVIVREFDPARIVLFGERLSAEQRTDAEYKFVVLLDAVERRWEKATEIRMAFGDLPVYAEVVVGAADEVDAMVEGPAIDHAGWALRDGLTLYERARSTA